MTMTAQTEFIYAKPSQQMVANPEEGFLREMLQKGELLTVFLINGVKLKGILVGFDETCVLLGREDSVQLVYKHAISTMMLFVERT